MQAAGTIGTFSHSSQSCWEEPSLLFWVRGEALDPKGLRVGVVLGKGQPTPHQLRNLGERCKLPQRGQGRSRGR